MGQLGISMGPLHPGIPLHTWFTFTWFTKYTISVAFHSTANTLKALEKLSEGMGAGGHELTPVLWWLSSPHALP